MSAVPLPTETEIASKEKELFEQGWTKQFTTFADRLQEYVELYAELGWQVQIEPWAQTLLNDPSCRDCMLSSSMRTIFVRKPSA